MAQAVDTEPTGDLFDSKLQQLLENAASRRSSSKMALAKNSSDAQQQVLSIPRLSSALAQNNGTTLHQPSDASADVSVPREVEPSKKSRKQIQKKLQAASAGSDWYNLPRTKLTPQTKRDLQLLQMRNVLDPHRHYRKTDQRGKFPQYSQVGTVVEGPTEFFSARLNKKDRKESLAADLLAGESSMKRFKNKYAEIQAKSTSGRKAHYKALKAKRAKGR